MNINERIKAGLEGSYSGLNNGFNRLNDYIFGVQKSCYTLIGGDSGTFKTTILDYIISNAIDDAIAKDIELEVFYYSFEIDKLSKQCNWLSRAVFNKYGVIISPKKIKGFGDNRLTLDEQELVNNCIPDIELAFSKIRFTWDPINPTGIRNDIIKFYESRGEILYEPYVDEKGNTQKKVIGYKPNNPNLMVINAIDHLYLMKEERGFDSKQNIDKMSEYTIFMRNTFGLTSFYLQQFNDGLNSVERLKFKGVDLSPQKSDFKDTRNPYSDSDIVLGLMNPYKLDMTTFNRYDVKKIGKNLVGLKILKNRLDEDNLSIGLYANPVAGRFEELPLADSPEILKYYVK